MIPKKIHYIWFGKSPLPEEFKQNIRTWKRFCPDYQIIEWNEHNYDFEKIPYMKEAYANQKWAFVSDYAKLDVVFQSGGIYLDIDVELIKPLDEMLKYKGFAGFETNEYIAFGLGFGAEAGNEVIQKVMEGYIDKHFQEEDGLLNMIPSPQVNTKKLIECGLQNNGCEQEINGFHFFPKDYFNPYDWATGKMKITKNTISIHHYAATWMTEGQKKNNIERHNYDYISRKYGITAAKIYSFCFWNCKKNGGAGVTKSIIKKIFAR